MNQATTTVSRPLRVAQAFKLRIQGVIHIGAFAPGDLDDYRKIGVDLVLAVDPALVEGLDPACHLSEAALQEIAAAAAQPGSPVKVANQARPAPLEQVIEHSGFSPPEFSYLLVNGPAKATPLLTDRMLRVLDVIDLPFAPVDDALTLRMAERGFVLAAWPVGGELGGSLFLRREARVQNKRSSAPVIYRIPRDLTKPESTFLLNFRRTVSSQLGEDGILSKIFEITKISRGYCVEAAAGDGVLNSNCHALWTQEGWRALLVEAEDGALEKLRVLAAETPDVRAADARAYENGFLDLDRILTDNEASVDYDFLSLDVRGNEWAIWDAHFLHRPKVVCVGFNPSFGNNEYFVQPQAPQVRQGSSLLAFVTLGKRKGYELVCATRWNAIFVSVELFTAFGIHDNSIDAIYAETPDFVNSFYQLYDGTIGLIGPRKHMWLKSPIDLDARAGSSPVYSRPPKMLAAADYARAGAPANIYLTPSGGLVNRLLTVVSCMRLADLFQRQLRMNWPLTASLNCPWEKLFAVPMLPFSDHDVRRVPPHFRFNLDAAVILDKRFRGVPIVDLNNATDDVVISSNCFIGHTNDERGSAFWNYTRSVADVGKYFLSLALSEDVSRLVASMMDMYGDFSDVVGLHVRRGVGDNPQSQTLFNSVTNGDYLKVVADCVGHTGRIFIATDSSDVRDELAGKLGERAIFYTTRSYAKDQNAEAIQDALVEFLLLSRCASIVGNRHSTFAYFASQIHLVPYFEVSRPPGRLNVNIHRYKNPTGAFYYSLEKMTL